MLTTHRTAFVGARGALFVGLLSLSACVSTTTKIEPGPAEPIQPKLPFRAALAPPAQHIVTGAGTPEAMANLRDGQGTDLFARDLEVALEDGIFSDVVLLRPPTDGSKVSEAYWFSEAKRVHADVLLVIDDLKYEAVPQNSSMWSSYAFFLMGPLEMIFPDRKYRFRDAEVGVSVFDMNQLMLEPPAEAQRAEQASTSASGPVTAQDADWSYPRTALLREMRVKPASFKLRYGDRLDGGIGAGALLKSFFIPTAHLSENSETAKAKVSESLSASFARGVAERIAEGDQVYILRPNRRVAPFSLAGTPRAVWVDGELEFEVAFEHGQQVVLEEGTLAFDTGERIPFEVRDARNGETGTATASNGQASAVRSPIAGERPGSLVRIRGLDRSVAVVPASAPRSGSASSTPNWVQLQIQGRDGLSDPRQRSWTIEIPARPSR